MAFSERVRFNASRLAEPAGIWYSGVKNWRSAHGAVGGGQILHTHLDAALLLVLLVVGRFVLVVLLRDGIRLRG